MSDEDEQDQEVQEEAPQTPKVDWEARFAALEAEQSESQAEIKRLVGENKKYRERAQVAEFSRLKALYPQLEPDDIAGLNADQVERLLSKVVKQEPGETDPDEPVDESAKKFVEGVGGEAPAPAKTYSPSEIQEIGLRDQAQALRLIAEGRMRSP